MAFYNSDKFPQWQQKLFIGALKDKDVIVMSVNGDKVTEDGRILTDKGQRIRDVRTGPDRLFIRSHRRIVQWGIT